MRFKIPTLTSGVGWNRILWEIGVYDAGGIAGPSACFWIIRDGRLESGRWTPWGRAL